MELFVVFKIDEDGEVIVMGAFDSTDKAIAACTSIDHCYVKLRLNEDLAKTSQEPELYYPVLEAQKQSELLQSINEMPS